MKRTWLIAVMLSLNSITALSAQKPFFISWHGGILRQWSLLYKHMPVEFATCLYGSLLQGEAADTLEVDFQILAIDKPSAFTATVGSSFCYSYGDALVGTAHSHPGPGGEGFSRTDELAWINQRRFYADSAPLFILDVVIYGEHSALFRTSFGYQARCTWNPELANINALDLRCETVLPVAPLRAPE